MKTIQFDVQLVLWVTSLVGVAAAFFASGHGRSTLPNTLFFGMLIILYPVLRFTRMLDEGTRFVIVGSVMLSIVMNTIIMAIGESTNGELDLLVWTWRVSAVAIATFLWLAFNVGRQ